MKQSLILFSTLFILTSFACAIKAENPSSSFQNSIEIPLGGNTYQSFGNKLEKINEEGIPKWSENETEFSIYFRSSAPKEVEISLDLLEQQGVSEISISLNESFQLKLNSGQSGKIQIGKMRIKQGYNEI